MDEAKKVAAAEGKDLFLLFTGSTWCGPCKELERDVLTKAEFASPAQKYVLVKFDYPPGVNRLPQEPPEPSPSWNQTYNGGRPSVVLADAAGRPYGVIVPNGFKAGPFIEHVQSLHAGRVRRDAAFAKAAAADGREKAAILAEALLTQAKTLRSDDGRSNHDLLLRFYRDELETVERLDAAAASGLMIYFDELRAAEQNLRAFYTSVDKTQEGEGIEAALKLVDSQIEATPSADIRNQLRRVKRNLLEQSNRFEEALALSRQLAADENSWAEDRLRDRKRIVHNLGRLGRVDEALAVWSEMFAEFKDTPWRKFWLLAEKANLLAQQERFPEALTVWDEAISMAEPGSENAREARDAANDVRRLIAAAKSVPMNRPTSGSNTSAGKSEQ